MRKISHLVIPSFLLVLITSLVMALMYSNQLSLNLLVDNTSSPLTLECEVESENESNLSAQQILEEDVHLPLTVTVPFSSSILIVTTFPNHLPFYHQEYLLDIIKPPSRHS